MDHPHHTGDHPDRPDHLHHTHHPEPGQKKCSKLGYQGSFALKWQLKLRYYNYHDNYDGNFGNFDDNDDKKY